jgi:exodeoxyribonuclease VII small subunit
MPETNPADTAGEDAGEAPATDVADLSYEEARDELVSIVARLEGGQVGLDESIALWQRGDALAARCTELLDAAEKSLSEGEA